MPAFVELHSSSFPSYLPPRVSTSRRCPHHQHYSIPSVHPVAHAELPRGECRCSGLARYDPPCIPVLAIAHSLLDRFPRALMVPLPLTMGLRRWYHQHDELSRLMDLDRHSLFQGGRQPVFPPYRIPACLPRASETPPAAQTAEKACPERRT